LRGGRGSSLAGFEDDFDPAGDAGAVLKGVGGRSGTWKVAGRGTARVASVELAASVLVLVRTLGGR
jgi:hypothetical protein